MSNININSLFQRYSDLVIVYSIILLSLSFTINGSTMHANCGTDIELTCPISSRKKSHEVITWFRPNSSLSQLTIISIGDILLPEYGNIGRYNLISSSSVSRLLISNVLLDDQGTYTCKSSSSGQHSIKLFVKPHLFLSPSSPLLLSPVNQTFSITCSLLCNLENDPNNLDWYINGELLNHDNHDYTIETVSSNTQRLTVHLNKKHKHFVQANYTCRYEDIESTLLVRRRTKEELHRLPRRYNLSTAYFLQNVHDTGPRHCSSLYTTVLILLFLSFLQSCNIL